MSKANRQPHNCGYCHGCKAELCNAKDGAVQFCRTLTCERVFTEAHRNLHGHKDSPYHGKCPKVTQ